MGAGCRHVLATCSEGREMWGQGTGWGIKKPILGV